MLLDQVIGSPISIGAFFVTLAIVERSSADEFLEELKSKSWRLYLAEWVVWPPAQLINFFFLPLRYRLLYDNTISLGYDVYTSYVKNEIHTEKTPKSPELPLSTTNNSRTIPLKNNNNSTPETCSVVEDSPGKDGLDDNLRIIEYNPDIEDIDCNSSRLESGTFLNLAPTIEMTNSNL